MSHRCLKYIPANKIKVSCSDHIAVPGPSRCFTINNIHRESVEKMYAQPIIKDNLTPLHYVEAFTRRILHEETASQDIWFLNYVELTMMRDLGLNRRPFFQPLFTRKRSR